MELLIEEVKSLYDVILSNLKKKKEAHEALLELCRMVLMSSVTYEGKTAEFVIQQEYCDMAFITGHMSEETAKAYIESKKKLLSLSEKDDTETED